MLFTQILEFPAISPEIFGFEIAGRHFAVTWYALAYITGILLGWQAIKRVINKKDYPYPAITNACLEDMFTHGLIGIILGGRLGYCLIYQPDYFLAHPLEIILPPYSGLSFHGGFFGFCCALILVVRKHKIPLLPFADLMALAAPLSIFLVRIANFINGELYGKASDAPWAMKFPQRCFDPIAQNCEAVGTWFYRGDEIARHPSQLYEAGLEGLVLGLVLWALYAQKAYLRPGLLTGVFFMGYGFARIFVERFRNADAQFISDDNPYGLVIRFGDFGLSMGQALSLPLVFIGIGFIAWSFSKHTTPTKN